MNCKEFKAKVLELKEQGRTITEISIEIGRHKSSVARHFSEKTRDRAKNISKNLKFQIDNYKVSKGCYLCSASDPRVLQFHHVNSDEKEHSISRLLSQGSSFKKVLREMEKCEVVCANCHLKLHNEL